MFVRELIITGTYRFRFITDRRQDDAAFYLWLTPRPHGLLVRACLEPASGAPSSLPSPHRKRNEDVDINTPIY